MKRISTEEEAIEATVTYGLAHNLSPLALSSRVVFGVFTPYNAAAAQLEGYLDGLLYGTEVGWRQSGASFQCMMHAVLGRLGVRPTRRQRLRLWLFNLTGW